jgi:ribosome biogenesis protein SSF1/2
MRDFVAMSGPLGVTHLVVFSQPNAATASSSADAEDEAYINLRISRLPRGPTLTFRVLRYSLARDILAASRRPKSPGKEYGSEALVRLSRWSNPSYFIRDSRFNCPEHVSSSFSTTLAARKDTSSS